VGGTVPPTPKSGGYGTPHSKKWGVRVPLVPPVSYAYEQNYNNIITNTQVAWWCSGQGVGLVINRLRVRLPAVHCWVMDG